MWATLIFGGTAFLFFWMTLGILFHLRWVRRLPTADSLAPTIGNAVETGLPRCTVVIAARDEEARIEGTVRCVLAQEGVEIELIVVDDRSSDRTGEILQNLALSDTRLKVKRVNALPEGWLGKCHACHIGASAATGGWMLFTDADCWLKPNVIARALQVANREAADHVTMSPGLAPVGVGANAWHLAFLMSLANWFSGVNRDRPKSYMGIGAFNLVRATAYRECGGYEALRLTVVDDVKLGLLLRRAGKRTRAFLGGDDVECHWGTTVRSMIKIMEKNYFAVIEFRVWVAIAGAILATTLMIAAVIGPFTGTPLGMAAGIAPLTLILPASLVARRLGWPISSAILAPFVYPCLIYAMVKSTLVTLRQGGIRWRDTFYALETLRAGTLR